MAPRTLTLELSQVEVAPNQSMATATGSSHHLEGMLMGPIDTTRMASWWSQALVWTQISQQMRKSRNRRWCSSLCSCNRISLRFLKALCRWSHKSCSKIKKENPFYHQQNQLLLVNIWKTRQSSKMLTWGKCHKNTASADKKCKDRVSLQTEEWTHQE